MLLIGASRFFSLSCFGNEVHNIVKRTIQRSSDFPEGGQGDFLIFSQPRKGIGADSGGKTQIRARHLPIDKQFPKSVIIDFHKTAAVCIIYTSYG